MYFEDKNVHFYVCFLHFTTFTTGNLNNKLYIQKNTPKHNNLNKTFLKELKKTALIYKQALTFEEFNQQIYCHPMYYKK